MDANLAAVAEKFTAELGIPVKVADVDPAVAKFQNAAASDGGPDIMIWADDRFGDWAAGGLIQAVSPSQEVVDGILPSDFDTVSFGCKLWGYPFRSGRWGWSAKRRWSRPRPPTLPTAQHGPFPMASSRS